MVDAANPHGALGGLVEVTAHLSRERPRVLLTDYDGTLAPFRPDRLAAPAWPGVTAALERIAAAGRTRVALVTGRAAAELDRVAGLAGRFEIWGVHGRERLRPGGRCEFQPVADGPARGLERACRIARRHGHGAALEDKHGAVALHLASDPAAREAMRGEWEPLAREHDLELFPFDGGIELRARGVNKGDVVRLARAEAAAAPVAFLGDDRTDEDGFAALGPRDLGVLVRAAARPTRARHWLRPPDELLALLARWAELDEGSR